MGRAKETFGKKEVRNRKEKKRKEKEKRKIEKKEQGKQSFDDMIAYVDENGMIVDTPPDPATKIKVDAKSIELGVPKKEARENIRTRHGNVTKFDEEKGYGFIVDAESKESIFIHINDCIDKIKAGDRVEFEVEKGPKGLKAKDVKIQK